LTQKCYIVAKFVSCCYVIVRPCGNLCFHFIVNVNLSEQLYALTILTLCVILQFIMYFTVIILL